MITLFYILIILGLSHCNDLLSKIEVESSINRTINEVERLIRQNSSIPHLSRHEIVDILVNITSKDLETYKDKEKIEEARKIYQRALMVVLPYNAENSEESMKELYTKPPIVEIITDPLHNQENYEAWKNAKLQLNKPTLHDKESIKNLIVTHTSERTMSEENPPEKVRYKNHKETYSEMNMNVRENIKFDSAPIKFSFNLENLGKPTTTKEPITTTKHPVFIKSTEDEDVDIIYSTSVTTEQSMRTSPKSASINSKESQTLFRPLKQNENVLSADQWRYHAPTSVPQSPVTSAKIPSSFKTAYKQSFSSISTLLPENISAPTEINKIENTSERETSKIISEEILIEDVEETTPIYVTPISSSSSPFFSSKKSNYNSTYNLNLGGFRKITTTTTTMRPEVMELIASIGLRPENTMHIEKVFERNKESFQNKSQVLDSNGLLYTTTSGLTAGKPDSQSIAGQNTFEGSVSELGKGMNNLTPDIRVLFQRFGLQTSNLVTSTPKPTTSGPTVNTNSYTNFKSLPTFRVEDQEMKEFLAKFGLGVSDNRHKKAMPASTERPSLIEAVPDNMKSILENIGLISRKTAPKVQSVEPIKISKLHVFKPHEVKINDEKQKMQINQLLDTIRLVQEGKASANDVRKAASDLLTTTKTLKNGPDPLSLEEIIAMYNSDVKNEVKRQQDSPKTVETVTNSNQDLTNNTTTSTDCPVPSSPVVWHSARDFNVTNDLIINVICIRDGQRKFIICANISKRISSLKKSVDVLSTTSSTTTTMTLDSAKDNSDFLDTLTSEGEKEREKESSTSTDTNLVALEESFGGTTRAPDPVLPKKPKSGLYFLLDWNTFLEVGDEDGEKVNLRFQPKAGDKSRFLPVTVP